MNHRDTPQTTGTAAHRVYILINLLTSPSSCLSVEGPLIFPADLLLLLRSEVVLRSHNRNLSIKGPLALAAHLLLLLRREVILQRHTSFALHALRDRQTLQKGDAIAGNMLQYSCPLENLKAKVCSVPGCADCAGRLSSARASGKIACCPYRNIEGLADLLRCLACSRVHPP